MQTPLVNPIIVLERPLEKVLKKLEYIAVKCHNTSGDNESRSYEINLPYFGRGSPEEWFGWKDKLLMALDGQSISTGLHTVDKVLAEMTNHAFPAYTFREVRRYIRRHQVKPKSTKLRSFISIFQELNPYLEEFPPDTEGQETTPLQADEIMDIAYHSMPTTWKNKLIKQG